MKTMSVKQFASEKGFTQIVPKVRVNENGYPYVTFIDGKNEAENIYFSKRAAEQVSDSMELTKEVLAGHQIGFVTNEAGEERVKLISNSERVDIDTLL